ncbi:MAG: GNAT family N-acetyltransferase [Anaerolineales bacterium]|nr:GNAT family N-acetyltransferase [Anaerolineales bacterium]
MSTARHIEEASLNAWPALQQLIYDGWILRFAQGYTKRANSINPLYPSGLDIETKVAACERVYGKMGLPAIFRLTSIGEVDELDAYLESRGYRRIDQTRVMLLNMEAGQFHVESGLELAGETPEVWLGRFGAMHQSTPEQQTLHGDILRGILNACLFATLLKGGRPLASGLGVQEGAYVGLFDLITSPDARRSGYGTNLLNGILRWAQARGASQAYLQVMENNHPARGMYEKEGFKDLYHYWYRMPE